MVSKIIFANRLEQRNQEVLQMNPPPSETRNTLNALNTLNPFSEETSAVVDVKGGNNASSRATPEQVKLTSRANPFENDSVDPQNEEPRMEPQFKITEVKLTFMESIVNQGVVVKAVYRADVYVVAVKTLTGGGELKVYKISLAPGGEENARELKLSSRKYANHIHLLYFSDDCKHVFLSFTTGETFHFDLLSKQNYFTPIELLTNIVVDVVAPIPVFSKGSADSRGANTSIAATAVKKYSFLLGCGEGKLLKLDIDPSDQFYYSAKLLTQFKDVALINQLFIHIERATDGEPCYFVLVLTLAPTRCYQFRSKSRISRCFPADLSDIDFIELPGSLEPEAKHRSMLSIKPSLFSSHTACSISTDVGVFYGKMAFDDDWQGDRSLSKPFLTIHGMIPATIYAQDGDTDQFAPILFSQSEFYYIFLLSAGLVVKSKINQRPYLSHKFTAEKQYEVAKDKQPSSRKYYGLFSRTGGNKERSLRQEKPLNQQTIAEESIYVHRMTEVPDSNSFLIITNFKVYKLEISDEASNVWKIYLDQAKCQQEERLYSLALYHCTTEQEQVEVYRAQADYFASEHKWTEAITYYVRCGTDFEELMRRLKELGDETTQKSTVHLLKLSLKSEFYRDRHADILSCLLQRLVEDYTEEKLDLFREIEVICSENVSLLGSVKEKAFCLVAGHDRLYVLFCSLTQDYEALANYLIAQQKGQKLLTVLFELLDGTSVQPVDKEALSKAVYKHSPKVMESIQAVIKLWRKLQTVEVEALHPAILVALKAGEEATYLQLMEYLEFLVYELKVPQSFGHNLLVSFYCNVWDLDLTSTTPEKLQEKLIAFVTSPMFQGTLAHCSDILEKAGYHVAKIELLCRVGQLKEAIIYAFNLVTDEGASSDASHLPLILSIPTRASTASHQRQLWVQVLDRLVADVAGKHLYMQEQRQLLELIRQSNGVVTTEDILSRVPESVQFKDVSPYLFSELEASEAEVRKVTARSETLQAELGKVQSEIRLIAEAKKQVKPEEGCSGCLGRFRTASTEQTFIFPCSHCFHFRCLLSELGGLLTEEQQAHVEVFVAILKEQGTDSSAAVLKSKAKEILFDFIGKSCPLCGEVRVQALAQPFISQRDIEEARDWEL